MWHVSAVDGALVVDGDPGRLPGGCGQSGCPLTRGPQELTGGGLAPPGVVPPGARLKCHYYYRVEKHNAVCYVLKSLLSKTRGKVEEFNNVFTHIGKCELVKARDC